MNFDSTIIYTSNLAKAIKFYQDILGLSLEYEDGEQYASFIFKNGARLGIEAKTKEREIPGAQTFILSIDEIDDLNNKLREAGVVFASEIKDYSWGRHFSIFDPDNNKIEFVRR